MDPTPPTSTSPPSNPGTAPTTTESTTSARGPAREPSALLHQPIRLALPKGRMHAAVVTLLEEAGIDLHWGRREYRPSASIPGFEVKLLKPQNIVEMLQQGSRDVGFAGADWVAELGADLVELLDTELDPVRLVAAAPRDLLVDQKLPAMELRIASEYDSITRRWVAARGLSAVVVRSYGATEVFPPEDADCIVDNTATGATLEANRLEIVDELMRSSTRLYASRNALADPKRREAIERFLLILRSVLEARGRAMVEVNVSADRFEQLISILPCMREPTVARLHGTQRAYAVKVAVPRRQLPVLIPQIRAAGGTDVVVSAVSQIVP